jgi:hypothetical protein
VKNITAITPEMQPPQAASPAREDSQKDATTFDLEAEIFRSHVEQADCAVSNVNSKGARK